MDCFSRGSIRIRGAVTLHNAREYVPGSFRLIRELVDFLTELEKDEYRDVRWVVEEVLSIVNGLNLPAIHEDLSFRQRKAISRKVRAANEEEHRLFERDPFIYFYEDYLRAYDKADEQEPRRLLYAAADCELHRAGNGRYSERDVRHSSTGLPITIASPCSISPAAPARSCWRCFSSIFGQYRRGGVPAVPI